MHLTNGGPGPYRVMVSGRLVTIREGESSELPDEIGQKILASHPDRFAQPESTPKTADPEPERKATAPSPSRRKTRATKE